MLCMKATENHVAQDEFLFFSLLFFVFVVIIVLFHFAITYYLSFFDIPALGFDERTARETLWSEE